MADKRQPRWEGDEILGGPRSAGSEARALEAFADPMRRDGWVTEQPLDHLAPKLREWLESHRDAPWQLERLYVEADRLVVELLWLGRGRARDLRADVYAVIGAFAEDTSFVEQREDNGTPAFDVATGRPDGAFAAHGHLVTIRVVGGPTP